MPRPSKHRFFLEVVGQTLRREVNETFAQGVTVVGRFGRDVRVRGCSESSNSRRSDRNLSSQPSELRRINRSSLSLKNDDVT